MAGSTQRRFDLLGLCNLRLELFPNVFVQDWLQAILQLSRLHQHDVVDETVPSFWQVSVFDQHLDEFLPAGDRDLDPVGHPLPSQDRGFDNRFLPFACEGLPAHSLLVGQYVSQSFPIQRVLSNDAVLLGHSQRLQFPHECDVLRLIERLRGQLRPQFRRAGDELFDVSACGQLQLLLLSLRQRHMPSDRFNLDVRVGFHPLPKVSDRGWHDHFLRDFPSFHKFDDPHTVH